MTSKEILTFCSLSLVLTIALCGVLYSTTSMSSKQVIMAATPQPMEDFDMIDLGEDYGMISVVELLGYYLDNPPELEVSTGVKPRKLQFGGC
jgi:hypothetical protein